MGWGHQGDPGGARGLLDSKLAGSQPPGAGRDAPLSLVIGGHRGGHAHASGRPGLAAGAAEDMRVFPWGKQTESEGKGPRGARSRFRRTPCPSRNLILHGIYVRRDRVKRIQLQKHAESSISQNLEK